MSLINFTEYFKELCEKEENKQIRESVINKIKHLYYINKPEKLVQEFRKIFNIQDDIKIKKVEFGGSYNPNSKEITFSTNNSLIHELVHYLQNRYGSKIHKYKFPNFSDKGLLEYMLQPLELNNVALSFADDALEYESLDSFLKSGKKSDNFETATRDEKLKHLIYLLQSDISYSKHTKDHKSKLLKLIKQYYYIIKQLNEDETKYIIDNPKFIDFV